MENKKRLLIFTDFFLPHWTGISKSMLYFIEGTKKYYDITVLTVRYDKKLKKKETIDGAQIIRSDYLIELSRSKVSINILIDFYMIVRKMDVILINSPSSNILPISIIAKIFKKKLIIFHQGDLILPKGFFNDILETIFDISSGISLMLCDTVATYTSDYAQHSRVIKPFLHKFKKMLMPIYFTTSNTKIESLAQLQKKGVTVFGFAGRFVEEKGFDILFSAIEKVVKVDDNVKFVFAGETNISYENFYNKNEDSFKKNSNFIINLGLLNESKIKEFYNSIDFIIIPSRSDCFNLVQAEAMLSGAPSIVSDIPGARVMVTKSKFGLIFKKENSEDLAEKILLAIKNKSNIDKYQKNVGIILDNKKNVEEIKNIIG